MKKTDSFRPDWDTYFMRITNVVMQRGNCIRRKVGAVIVKDKRIISTGYNGTPSGITNCFEGGCKRCASDVPSGADLGECICAHAEENAIVHAALHGVSLKGSVIYCTDSPCLICSRMIIGAGICEVIFQKKYRYTRQAADLFAEAGVKFRQFNPE
jgi:dCMP deaminase